MRKGRPGTGYGLLGRVLCGAAALLMLAAAFMPGRAYASGWDRDRFNAGHIAESYNISSGMPFSEYNAVVQTTDGFVWFGGYGGLVCYDGKEFNLLNQISSVVSLWADPDGSLWVGTNDAGIIHMDNEQNLHTYGEAEGLQSLSVSSIVGDGKGNVFFGTKEGMFQYDSDGNFHSMKAPKLRNVSMSQLTSDGRGSVYGTTMDGDIFLLKNGVLEIWHDREECLNAAGSSVTSVCPDPEHEGFAYIGTEGSRLLHGRFDMPVSTYRMTDLDGVTCMNRISFAEGRMWICANTGVVYREVDGKFQNLGMAPFSSAGNMMQDYEGNLWFVSTRNGALKVSRSMFTDISIMSDMGERVVNTVWLKDGVLYVGTDTGLVALDTFGRSLSLGISDLLKAERVRAVREDSKGNLWFCTYGNEGLVCLRPDGTTQSWNEKNGLLSNYVRTVFELSDGSIVVSVRGGVQYIKDGKIVRSYDMTELLSNPLVLCITEDRDGIVYLGTDGGGIWCIEKGRLHPFEGENEISSGFILRMKRDRKRGLIWVASNHSVGILKDGKVTDLKTPQISQAVTNCYDIIPGDDGRVWLLCGSGIYVAEDEALLNKTAQEVRYYSLNQGLPHIPTSNSRNCLTPEGELFIAGVNGISMVNISSRAVPRERVRLAMPYIDVDRERVYISPGENIRLSSGVQRISFYGFALSFSLDDPEVTYYLEGFDKEPHQTTMSDLDVVSYTNLRGGDYVFHLTARDPVSGEEYGIHKKITKEKAFYEEAWFFVLLDVGTLLGLVVMVRSLLRRQARALNRRKEEERIAAELNMAASIQAGALPRRFPAFPERNEFDIYASMTPAREVGGDFYDFFMIDTEHLGLVIADVSGKGIPAAMFMMRAKGALSDAARSGKSPAEVLTEVNEVLCWNNEADMFVTVWFGVLNLTDGTLTAANAGHEYPVLQQPGEKFEILKDKHDLVMGSMEGIRYHEYQLKLRPGAAVFVYTDGAPEANDTAGRFFGLERLVEALNRESDASPEKLVANADAAVRSFAGAAPQFDDLTMLCVRYYGA